MSGSIRRNAIIACQIPRSNPLRSAQRASGSFANGAFPAKVPRSTCIFIDVPGGSRGYNAAMRLSIIVPTLNEAARLAATLAPLQAMRARGVEVIVADGGSKDDTKSIAKRFADRVIDAPRGCARQMNTGAAAASGDTFSSARRHRASCRCRPAHRNGTGSRNTWGRFDVAISGGPGCFRSLRGSSIAVRA